MTCCLLNQFHSRICKGNPDSRLGMSHRRSRRSLPHLQCTLSYRAHDMLRRHKLNYPMRKRAPRKRESLNFFRRARIPRRDGGHTTVAGSAIYLAGPGSNPDAVLPNQVFSRWQITTHWSAIPVNPSSPQLVTPWDRSHQTNLRSPSNPPHLHWVKTRRTGS